MYTRYHLYIDIDSIVCLSSHPGKSDKNIIKTETITKALVKFQKSQHKKVGGVANSRYPVSDTVTLMVINASTCVKSNKNKLTIISKTSSDNDLNICKVLKQTQGTHYLFTLNVITPEK